MAHQIELSEHAERIVEDVAASCGVSAEQYLLRFIESWAAQVAAGERLPDQAWYWTPEWQAGERAAAAGLAAGRSTRFESDEAFLEALEAHVDDATEPSGEDRR